MKEQELRTHAVCSLCEDKIMAAGLPLFWTVTVARYGIKAKAVERQQGLAMLLGSAALAQVMGPDEDMTVPMMDPVTLTVCENCCTKEIRIAGVVEGK